MANDVEFGQDLRSKYKKNKQGLILYPPKSSGSSIIIRFLGVQQRIYQQWDRHVRSFSFSDVKKEGYIVRVMSFVIDRADERIKAFLCPSTVFTQCGQFGPNHDFKIDRQGAGLQTRYIVKSLGETVVDDDTLEKIKITSKIYSLSDIFVKKVKWEILNTEAELIEDRFDILDL